MKIPKDISNGVRNFFGGVGEGMSQTFSNLKPSADKVEKRTKRSKKRK